MPNFSSYFPVNEDGKHGYLARNVPVGIPTVDSSQESEPALLPKILEAQSEKDVELGTLAPHGLVHFVHDKVSCAPLLRILHPEQDSKNVPSALKMRFMFKY